MRVDELGQGLSRPGLGGLEGLVGFERKHDLVVALELGLGAGGAQESPAATPLAGANVPERRNANFSPGLGLLMPT